MQDISCIELPIPDRAFFEQAVLERDLGQGLLQLASLRPEAFDLLAGGFPRRIAGQPLLASLQELLRPAVIEVLVNALLAAKLGDTVLPTQASNHNPDLVFRRKMPTGRTLDIADCLLGCLRKRFGFLMGWTPPDGIDVPRWRCWNPL
jgi:hypothetical protein